MLVCSPTVAPDQCDLLCLDLPRAEELRHGRVPAGAAEAAAAVAQALADPTRLTIAAALDAGGELCGCDLAWITGHSQKLVSHHLKALRAAGLVRSRREGKIAFHSLTEPGAALLAAVLATRKALA
jgi:DNA-binding transcriptional ArsR family regulator